MPLLIIAIDIDIFIILRADDISHYAIDIIIDDTPCRHAITPLLTLLIIDTPLLRHYAIYAISLRHYAIDTPLAIHY
jgi:hypothetical protein